MKKIANKIQAHRIPLYDGYLVLAVADSAKAIKKYFPDLTEDTFSTFEALTFNDNHNGKRATVIVFNTTAPVEGTTHGTIAHENLHFVTRTLEYISAPPISVGPDEFLGHGS